MKAALVELEGGSFLMGNPRGDGYPQDGEEPVHEVALSPFAIGSAPVTNAEFAAFAAETGYLTEAEKTGWSFVFTMFLPEDFEPTRAIERAPWWRQVFGAQWRHPEGPQSDVTGLEDHPVTHVSWDDANAYCEWAGLRLPTEAEWEFAARGGIGGAQFPWGDELEPDGRQMMNVFQGEFPARNTREDGWAGTSPVGSFEPNGYGLFDTTGNVWEWCADRFGADTYREGPRENPKGPQAGDQRVIRGGSYLCHASYCRRYRVDARSSNTPDSTSGNTGFRVAASR